MIYVYVLYGSLKYSFSCTEKEATVTAAGNLHCVTLWMFVIVNVVHI